MSARWGWWGICKLVPNTGGIHLILQHVIRKYQENKGGSETNQPCKNALDSSPRESPCILAYPCALGDSAYPSNSRAALLPLSSAFCPHPWTPAAAFLFATLSCPLLILALKIDASIQCTANLHFRRPYHWKPIVRTFQTSTKAGCKFYGAISATVSHHVPPSQYPEHTRIAEW